MNTKDTVAIRHLSIRFATTFALAALFYAVIDFVPRVTDETSRPTFFLLSCSVVGYPLLALVELNKKWAACYFVGMAFIYYSHAIQSELFGKPAMPDVKQIALRGIGLFLMLTPLASNAWFAKHKDV